MQNTFINHKNTPFQNKLQHKLIVFISTLKYINSKYKKYTQNNILYYFNENLKRNGQPTVKLKTMQNYLYKLEKELKVTTNYHKHLGVNFGTEIYYKLNYPKKECHLKINQYFKEKKDIRFQTRVNRHLKDRFTKEGNLNFGECNNNNNKEEEETKNRKIEKYQIKKYFNKCNFLSKEAIYILDLNISKDKIIEILKIVKKIEINLTKKNNKNKVCFKERQNKLKEILKNIQKEFEKDGYDAKQMKLQIESIYKNYKNKPHFIIENKKYEDLNKIKLKLEKSIEIKKENPTKKYIHIRINIFNILIEQLKKEFEIKSLKSIIKNYLNNKKPLEYNKVFSIYYYELLEIIKKEKNKMDKKLLSQDVI
ncbi:plasmid maintenance protein [Borreliella bissettiae]|uniref:plasmid maintenance protein n=1 Tax=Borrelia bissettiae TaxID=64897 RepID=UPI001E3D0839|nr:plasmid maintenance protein [Borreliella bissettiae]MCD2401575.1 plasmid maintenance protein [Borreliella bissettiae]